MKTRALLGAAAALMALAVPATAGAQVRGGAFVGVDYMNHAPTSLSLRVEGTMSLIPWFHIGAYGTALNSLDQTTSGYSVGGLITFRPKLPLTDIDPMGFASLGYQRTPGDAWDSGAVLQLGGGLVFHTTRYLDLELRAAYVQMLASNDDSTGIAGSFGLSLHP